MIKVSAKDFGPIIEGTVELKPLTIFIGPSNSGKSYLATLLYALLQRGDRLGTLNWSLPRYRVRRSLAESISEDVSRKDLRETVQQWKKELAGAGKTAQLPFASLPESMRAHINKYLGGEIRQTFAETGRDLQAYFGELSQLARRYTEHPHLQVRLKQESPPLDVQFVISDGSLKAQGEKHDLSQGVLNLRELEFWFSNIRTREQYFELLFGLLEGAISAIFSPFPNDSYYLPAARSGIVQGHKAIASILVRQSSFAGIEPLQIPTLSGVITNFISLILTIERRPRPSRKALADVVAFLEAEVVHGKVDIEHAEGLLYPEISYEPGGAQSAIGKIPLHRTSSMVSELAPFVLFLKYLVDPGDLVILEEPESHLHPASQLKMARAIVRLVNKGVKVLITTHSDYFVGQLNNLMRLSSASKSRVAKEGYTSEDVLKPADVAAYNFAMQEAGSIVEELPIRAEEGIPEEEFVRVDEALYNEAISLQRIRRR